MRAVRSFDIFYESRGRYAVDAEMAKRVVGRTVPLMSKYTGEIAVNGVRGVQLRSDMPPAIYDLPRLPGGSHTVLLTQREVIFDPSKPPHYGGLSTHEPGVGHATKSTIVVGNRYAADVQGYVASEVLLHEMGHTFGLGHCAVNVCAMIATEDTSSYMQQQRLVSGIPFCDNCAGELELAGYQALAAEL